MKIYAVFLIILLIILQLKFWFEEGGYFYNLGLEEELAAVKQENAELKARNQELARQIILVKENMDEIEALARKNLGMIKEGEQFMFIIDEESEATDKPKPGVTQPKDDTQ
ncbi:MAG: septum formation initiator family protein [Gammaproteobacteria bacterium]|nr:septum formation initiator family protein [Gammaproteobacteria bacterium]